MSGRGKLGRKGEAIAARFLEAQGYAIMARNYRCPVGEIDLIATAGQYLVFVEVKTRSGSEVLHPSQSVTARKQAKVRQVGAFFCSQHPQYPLQPRFDVIAVELAGQREKVEHIVNAF